MIGTYILVTVGPASVVVASLAALPAFEGLLMVALVFGLTVATMITVFGKRSGANINPAVTFATASSGYMEWKKLLPYICFQVIGGLFAGLTLKLVFGSLAPSAYLGSTKLAAGVSPLEGTALEVLGTFVLSMSALTAASVVKTTSRQALLVGGTLSTLILFIGPLTGASFNPARSLGPSLFSGYCDSQLVYWVGPLIGGACAGSIFRRLRKPR